MRLFPKVMFYLCLSLLLALSACKPKAQAEAKPETPPVLTDTPIELTSAEDLQTESVSHNEVEASTELDGSQLNELDSEESETYEDEEVSDAEESLDEDSESEEGGVPERGQEIQVRAPNMRSIGNQDVLAKKPSANLLIPANGESTRFPKDFIVGNLDISEEFTSAGQEAWKLLQDVLQKGSNSKAIAAIDPVEREYILSTFSKLNKPELRLGSPQSAIREEVSFLIRVFDKERSISGEVFLASEENGWTLSDIYLEEAISFDAPEMRGVFDPFSYKRFFQE